MSDDLRSWLDGALQMSKLCLTALISTCAGGLVALLSFGAQAKPLSPELHQTFGGSLILLGGALWFSLAAATLGYFHQNSVWMERELRWLLLAARILGVAALFMIPVGFLLAFKVIMVAVG